MSKPCIFCQKEGSLSKEHLWPNWLNKMYVRKGDEKYISGSVTSLNKEVVRDGEFERPGHLFTLKNRVVCCECNNGWMSEVESETKPVIIKMISGQKCKITNDELRLLAFWIAMKIVTAEFADKEEELYVTPVEERIAMMKERKLPSYFNVFLSGHSIKDNAAWLRHSWTMSFSPEGPQPSLDGRGRNAQSIAFVIGPIFIYVIHVRLLGFVPEQHFRFGGMEKIWPSRKHFIRWPSNKLEKSKTNAIAFMTQDLTESSHVNFIEEMPE